MMSRLSDVHLCPAVPTAENTEPRTTLVINLFLPAGLPNIYRIKMAIREVIPQSTNQI